MFEEEDSQGVIGYHPVIRENVTRMLMEGGELNKMLYFLEVFLLGEFEHRFSQRRP